MSSTTPSPTTEPKSSELSERKGTPQQAPIPLSLDARALLVFVAFAFVWVGLLVGISFMEAPMKFTVLERKTALGLGLVIFNTLNKMELVLACLLGISGYVGKPSRELWWWVIALFCCVAMQTLWLKPALSADIVRIVKGGVSQHKGLHPIYVGLEVLKVGLLLRCGVLALRQVLRTALKTHIIP